MPSKDQHSLGTSTEERYWNARAKHYGINDSRSVLCPSMPQIYRLIWQRRQHQAINKVLRGKSRVEKLLDVGCGNGRYYPRLERVSNEYVGVDISEELIKQAKSEFPHVDFRVMSATNLDFVDQNFTAVVAVGVVHHLNRDNQSLMVREISRVLVPGAWLVITVYVSRKDISSRLHPRGFSEWIDFFRANNFAIVTVKPFWYGFIDRTLRSLLKRISAIFIGTSGSDIESISGQSELDLIKKLDRSFSGYIWSALMSLVVIVNYPLEIIASLTLPAGWAEQVVFVVQKRGSYEKI